MKIDTYEYNGETYEFVLTPAAKVAIEEMDTSILDSEDKVKAIMEFTEIDALNKEYDALIKAGKEDDADKIKDKINALTVKIFPQVKELMKYANSTVDKEKVAYLLLKNNRKYKDKMNEELFSEIIDAMVEELGYEEYCYKLINICDKVFTVIEKVKDKETAVFKKTTPKFQA